ncbi:MAG: hypothetical protein R3C53_06695 [Pirellulaceae bacterium]
MDAWKSGATVDDQLSHSPPVYVSDELWQDGFQLINYQLIGDSEPYGPNVRVQVELECKRPSERARKYVVCYLISTAPAITIARQEQDF